MLQITICAWNCGFTDYRAKSHLGGLGQDQCHDTEKITFPDYLKDCPKILQGYYKKRNIKGTPTIFQE